MESRAHFCFVIPIAIIFVPILASIYLTSIIVIVDQARDTLATDMMSFVAKDADLAGLIAK